MYTGKEAVETDVLFQLLANFEFKIRKYINLNVYIS